MFLEHLQPLEHSLATGVITGEVGAGGRPIAAAGVPGGGGPGGGGTQPAAAAGAAGAANDQSDVLAHSEAQYQQTRR